MKKSAFLLVLFIFIIFSPIKYANSKIAFSPEQVKPRVINIAAEFVQYWEQAKDLPMEDKVKLWDEMIESKHKNFYQQIIYQFLYGTGMEKAKEEKLIRFLETVPDRIDRIKECAFTMEDEIVETLQLFKAKYPEFVPIFDYYLAISLDQADGAVRPFNNSIICFFGVDAASNIKSKVRRQALIAHESFHLYQFSHLMPKIMQKYGQINTQQFMAQTGAGFWMFIEGQAVRATEHLLPEAGLYAVYEKLIPEIKEKMPQLADELLQNMQPMSPQIYKKYFLDPNDDTFVPKKSAYYMGYLIVKELEEEYSMAEMVKWDFDTINQKMADGLKKLKEVKIK